MAFRHAEVKAALCTVLGLEDLIVEYTNALSTSFDASTEMSEYQNEVYQNALQYVHFYSSNGQNLDISKDEWIRVVQRCSLIRGAYEIVAKGYTCEELAQNALEKNSLGDLMLNGANVNSTWRVRLRQYGSTAATGSKSKQYGKKMRSPLKKEREAVTQLKELLIKFGGEVDLKDADVSIYVLEGLTDGKQGSKKLLARLLTKGGGGETGLSTSSIAPNTRLCVTNTPLAPIEAFTICNVARIKNGDRILDPFGGSCSTLLAASMLAPSIRSVGIEISHNGKVNRQHVFDDFNLRNLTLPVALIHGDAMDQEIREEARDYVGSRAFDAIVTDPPYGIREKTGFCEDPPLIQLVKCIGLDRNNGRRLLKKSGRLVAFVPHVKGTDVRLAMPSQTELDYAGLEFCQMLEQPLNDSLTRWLVEYKCIR